MDSDTGSLLIILLCVVFSAYFSATETAFSSLNLVRMKTLAEKGDKKAARVVELHENFDKLLSTILIGNNVVNILLTAVATVLCVKILGEAHGTTAATLITTVIVLIFGEVTPKSLAKDHPESFASFSAPLLSGLIWLLTPFTLLFSLWKKVLTHFFPPSTDSGFTDEELSTLIDEATQEGNMDEQEGNLIQNAIDFMDVAAAEIQTPRIDILGVDLNASDEEIVEAFADRGFSRLPVFAEDIDHIVGMICHKDYYTLVHNTNQPLSRIIRPVEFAAETTKVGSLLKQMQAQKCHMAVIIDEFGGTSGIVTMEDILEELVGEIWDEHDSVVEEIQKISDTEYLVLGNCSIDKLYDELDIDKDFDVFTVTGWAMEVLERIPREGDVFTTDNLKVTVLKMDDRRLEQIRIEILPASEEKEQA